MIRIYNFTLFLFLFSSFTSFNVKAEEAECTYVEKFLQIHEFSAVGKTYTATSRDGVCSVAATTEGVQLKIVRNNKENNTSEVLLDAFFEAEELKPVHRGNPVQWIAGLFIKQHACRPSNEIGGIPVSCEDSLGLCDDNNSFYFDLINKGRGEEVTINVRSVRTDAPRDPIFGKMILSICNGFSIKESN